MMESIQIALLLLAAFSLCCSATSEQRPQASRRKDALVRWLLSGYDTDVEPPVASSEFNTTVKMGLHVQCVTPLANLVSVESWTSMMWTDARLRWDPADFDGIRMLHISASRIWTPDLRLYNAIKTDLSEVRALVSYDGDVTWIPPVNYLFRCHDEDNGVRHCSLKFGLWTYSSDIVDLDMQEYEPGDFVDFSGYSVCPSVVTSHQSRRNVMYYEAVPEPYADLTVNFQLARRYSR